MRVAQSTTPVATEPSTSRQTVPATAPEPVPRYQQVLGRVRRKLDEFVDDTRASLLSTPDWERYRLPPRDLPASYPAEVRTPVRTGVPASVSDIAYRANHDIFTDGDLAVPNQPGVAVPMADLLRRRNWPEIVRNDLSVGTGQPNDPVRFFIPGLNTDMKTAEARLHVAAAQTDTALALIANGSTWDLPSMKIGGIEIPSRNREWLQAGLQRIGVDFSGWDSWVRSQQKDAQGRIAVPPGSSNWLSLAAARDFITTAYEVSDPNRRLVDSIQRMLIAFIDKKDAPPMELWAYSEGTLALGLAFETLQTRYLAQKMRGVSPYERNNKLREYRNEFERRLQSLTVLCIGPAYAEFKAPVPRVDFYSAQNFDKVTRFAGSPRVSQIFRRLQDTTFFTQHNDVYIPFQQPYTGFDSHNFYAVGGSALKLYFEQNGTRTVRGLYDAEHAGTLRAPSLEQVVERARRDGAAANLWDKNAATIWSEIAD